MLSLASDGSEVSQRIFKLLRGWVVRRRLWHVGKGGHLLRRAAKNTPKKMAEILSSEFVVRNFGGRSYRCHGGGSYQRDSADRKTQRGAERAQDEAKHSGMAMDHDLDIRWDESRQLYALHHPVMSVFYPFIIGKKSATLQRIQSDTGAQIIIPKKNDTTEIIGRAPKHSHTSSLC